MENKYIFWLFFLQVMANKLFISLQLLLLF